MNKNLDDLLLIQRVEKLYRVYLRMGITPNKSCFMIKQDIHDKLTVDKILKVISKHIAKQSSYDKEFPKQEIVHYRDLY